MSSRNHRDVIKAAGAQRLSDALRVSIHTVRSWALRDSIPAEHWRELADLSLATLEELADAAAARRTSAETGAAA